MDADAIPFVIAFMTLCFSVAGVLVLRPMSKRVAELLGAMAQERKGGRTSDLEVAQLRATLESVNARMALLEDRLDFTERLLSAGGRTGREPAEMSRGER
jgi:hypothetical protein